MTTVDLNADVGESFGRWSLGDDFTLLQYVTSANVAAGFHAGDPAGIRSVCERAAQLDVRVGAHPGYRDLAGFGRRPMDIPRAELRDDLIYQIGAVSGMARAAGTSVSYVKAHGALYNRAVEDPEQAGAIVDAVTDFDPKLAVVVMPGSVLWRLASEAGLRTVIEAYADRAYTATGQLVSRREAGSVLTDTATVVDRVVRLVTEGRVTAIDGTVVELTPDSICLHGDTPGAVDLARAVHSALRESKVEVRAVAEIE